MIPKYKVWDTVKKAMSEVQAIVYTELGNVYQNPELVEELK